MTNDDWKTLRVPVEAYEEAKEQKEAEGRTWGEQLIAPVTPEVDDAATPEDVQAARDEILSALGSRDDYAAHENVEELASAMATVEERTGRIERAVEQLGGGR